MQIQHIRQVVHKIIFILIFVLFDLLYTYTIQSYDSIIRPFPVTQGTFWTPYPVLIQFEYLSDKIKIFIQILTEINFGYNYQKKRFL